MVEHALSRGWEVVGVCRAQSVAKLSRFADRITVVPGHTNDAEVIRQAVRGCDGVLTVLVPWGVEGYATGTAQAVLDHAEPHARLIFSCGWHISMDGRDRYSWGFRAMLSVFGFIARLFRFADLGDQVEATRRVFASDRKWTVVRGSDLEEGESQGLPAWSEHVGDLARYQSAASDERRLASRRARLPDLPAVGRPCWRGRSWPDRSRPSRSRPDRSRPLAKVCCRRLAAPWSRHRYRLRFERCRAKRRRRV